MEDLLERYNGDSELFDKVIQYCLNNLIDTHPKYKVGQTISFMGGYDDDINYVTKIIGFNEDGDIFLFWDCYWFPVRDEKIRKIKVLTDKQFLDKKIKHANEVRDTKLAHDAFDELIEIYE